MAHDPILVKNALKSLEEARRALASIPLDQLSYAALAHWHGKFKAHMARAERITGSLIGVNAREYVRGYQLETDNDVLDAIRRKTVDLLDRNLEALGDTKVTAKPELDQLIAKVKPGKLATLLRELQDMQASQPNSAAVVLRTIICLIIKERARAKRPELRMAQTDDLNFAGDLRTAIDQRIFDGGDQKYLENFKDSNLRDLLDNITHKYEEKWLIKDKSDLVPGIELVTKLLYAVV